MRILLFILLFTVTTSCQTSHPTLEGNDEPLARVQHAPTIDGELREAAWQYAPAAELKAWGPQPISGATVYLLHDAELLFVGVNVPDSDITCRHLKHDQPLYEDDCIEIMIAWENNPARYYEIVINATNRLYDATIFNPERDRQSMVVDTNWQAKGIRHAVKKKTSSPDLNSSDWQVELELPFKTLGLKSAPASLWINFHRVDPGANPEFYSWQGAGRETPDFHQAIHFRRIQFQ